MGLDRITIRNWLLGSTSDVESEELEVRMIEDEAFSGEVSLAENELIEDYIEGSLSNNDKKLFEWNFLTSDERREMVQEVALLKRYSSGSMSAFDIKTPRTWTQKVLGMRPMAAGIAVLAVLLTSLLGWQMVSRSGRTLLESQYTELNNSDLSDLSLFSSVQIMPGTIRNAGTNLKVKVNGPGDSFLFRLPLTSTPDPQAVYKAVLATSGSGEFTVDRVNVYNDGPFAESRLLVPRAVIAKGQCQITLTPKDGGPPIVYSFIAE